MILWKGFWEVLPLELQMFPKCCPCQDFFGGFVHTALRALQSDHLSPKSDNFPPKVWPYTDIIIIILLCKLKSFKKRLCFVLWAAQLNKFRSGNISLWYSLKSRNISKLWDNLCQLQPCYKLDLPKAPLATLVRTMPALYINYHFYSSFHFFSRIYEYQTNIAKKSSWQIQQS